MLAAMSHILARVSRTSFPRSNALCRPFSNSAAPLDQKNDVAVREDDPADQPLENLANPYEKPKTKCILCAQNVKLDYKNARLLQQFVSNFSGRVYERHITGLCEKQQKLLLATISQSRRSGYMPIVIKDPRYLRDPKLFDPMRPIRPHPYA
uniref:Mitochondrial ribosomal protein S18C n=1 Tax=Plectus sambesii TaxID=2011161 RepID=A0A914V633_9BILA